MGRIKKAATERHTATLSPFVQQFVEQATRIPLHQLPSHLDKFPQQWPLPRGDLYHWIPLLDRFDHVLELFNKEYALNDGPQAQPFERRLLQKGDAEEGRPYPSVGGSKEELESSEYSAEGDRELIEAVLHFTRILLENCGNRSLYASSSHINDLLHTSSLSLLQHCLKLSLRLAQRYQVARYKNHQPNAQASILASHYNLNLDNMHKIAWPWAKPYSSNQPVGQLSGKARDKAAQPAAFNPSDLVSIAKDPIPASTLSDMSNVSMTYYESAPSTSRPASSSHMAEATPSTPTPARRTSNLGPARDRPSMGDRTASSEGVSGTPVKSRDSVAQPSNAAKLFHVPGEAIAQHPAWYIVKDALPKLPEYMHYEFLHRVRIAKAFASQESTSQQLLEIRLLAIANLAYALGESKFQDRIGTADAEEPRRYHLASQLCDLLQPATNKQTPLTLQCETAVMITLEALTKSRSKAPEVADALALTVNHGVLYYELRKVISTLNVAEHTDKRAELQEAEWRDIIFDLISSLLQSNAQARYGEKMVAAGVIGILVEALNLRTTRAEKFHERILQFFDNFTSQIPNAFHSLAQAKGLDIIADLTAYEVDASLDNVRNGRGLSKDFKSKVVDYEIPYYQQATLRQVLKNTTHMFDTSSGTHDRLLRNLIDTPQTLSALRKIIENANIFGSNVWCSAVMIISNFINREPTSYQVIGEAGLSKSLLEAVTGQSIPDEPPAFADIQPVRSTGRIELGENGSIVYPAVDGVLPVGDVMNVLPNVFGAICLNETGMRLFLASGAIAKYFDLFLSPVHVRAMEEEGSTATSIGQAFDELSRHHPGLKPHIKAAIFNMLRRLNELCDIMAKHVHNGAKLWKRSNGRFLVAGGQAAAQGPRVADYDQALFGNNELRLGSNSESIEDDGVEDERDRAPAIPFMNACFKFLDAFLHNNTMCNLFCEDAGAELLLDLAMSACNPPDYVAHPLFNKLAQIFKTLVEARPHLVLPSIVRRAQWAALGLKQFMSNQSRTSAFIGFTNLSEPESNGSEGSTDGTTLVKSLLHTHIFTHVLGRALASPPYAVRHDNQRNHPFSSLNFTEVYIELIDTLSKVHASCVWEQLLLTPHISDEGKIKTEPKPYIMRRVDANGIVEVAADRHADASHASIANDKANGSRNNDRAEVLATKNTRTLRYLLNQVPMGIESVFTSLGQAIVTKRMDATAKQYAMLVADHIAKALIWELSFRRTDSKDDGLETRYVASMLGKINRIILRNSMTMEPGAKEALTLVLLKFYLNGGFEKLNGYLEHFMQLLAQQQDQKKVDHSAKDAVHQILSFYGQVVRSKCINDTVQAGAIASRDHNQPDFFVSGHFLVEIRDAVLPAIDKIWHSKDIEHLGDIDMKGVVEILRIILKAEGEDRALKRSQRASRRVPVSKPEFRLRSQDGLDRLTSSLGFDAALSREAVYRCNNNPGHAEAYARLRTEHENVPRFPIPDESVPTSGQNESAPSQTDNAPDIEMSGDSIEQQDHSDLGNAASESAQASSHSAPTVTLEPGGAHFVMSPESNEMAEGDDDVNNGSLGRLPANLRAEDLHAIADPDLLEALGLRGSVSAQDTKQMYVTVDDLDDKRKAIRGDLVDRCLDVLSTQPALTFELADLIQAAVAKSGESANPRQEIGETLFSSLVSLQGEEPTKEAGRKIHAYAHLVALILQDRDFFDSTLDELKEYFDNLVKWVKLEPEKKVEDAPYIEMILLIIERVLAEDEQPVNVEWKAPPADKPLTPLPEPSVPDTIVPEELRSQLFDAMVDLLPKIGKNAALALSVSRVLVVLTRKRGFAERLSDKRPMSSLFVMVKQLAGAVDEKLQASIMLLLRHMVEDDEMIRQIMRTEIRVALENHRTSRNMDTTTYTRLLHHLVLRNPEIFVETTQELMEVTRFSGNAEGAQSLALKKERSASATAKPQHQVGNASSSADAATNDESSIAPKSEDLHTPIVETTDGIINFLLRQLTTYRDVEDQLSQNSKAGDGTASPTDTSSGDIEMFDVASSTSEPTTTAASAASLPSVSGAADKTSKTTSFNPDEHQIYVYRCFILQCLTELLGSYNKTKIEFINFSRKAETQPTTPSKPRVGTLHYLLQNLLPVGSLEHRDDTPYRKRVATSNWATQVVVALCAKTPERLTKNAHSIELGAGEFAEQEPELSFVRKFVLDHALRVFNEVTKDQKESLHYRYSRLLALGELFNRMLNDKADLQRSSTMAQGYYGAQQQMARLMIEKNFIATLTQALAEIDLNFPNAKRAVKYILSPLKQLTERGVTLSQTSELSSAEGTGTSADEDEVSNSETDQTEDEDAEREQTPDLFRGSSLSMLEAARHDEDDDDDDSGSDSDDDEEDFDMDGYEEGYDEEEVPDHGEVVSDEDEDDDDAADMGEIEGVPGDVEIEVDMMMGEDDEDESDDEDDEDVSDDDDEDDESDHDGDDFDAHMHMEEITGDDDNASMGEHGILAEDEADWEDDGMDFDGDEVGSPHGGPLEHIAQVIGAADPSDSGEVDGIVRIDMGGGDEEFFEDELPPEDDEDEDDDEMEFAEDIVYEPEMEDEDEEDLEGGWTWDALPPRVQHAMPAARRPDPHHHHHHHHRGLNEMLGMLGGGGPIGRPRGAIRSHGPTPNARDEDGINPLLQRGESLGRVAHRERDLSDLPARFAARRAFGLPRGDGALPEILSHLGGGAAGGVININIDPGMHALGALPPVFGFQAGGRGGPRAMIDIDPSRPWQEQLIGTWPQVLPGHRMPERGAAGNEEAQCVDFRTSSTINRWQEEARILFPGGKAQEKAARVIGSLFRALVPAAMEAKRIAEKEEAERKAAAEKAAEEARKKEEAERVEREAQEQKEREEREAKEREEAETRAREDADQVAQAGESNNGTEMEGVEQGTATVTTGEAQSEAVEPNEPPAERVTITIRGRELDITNLGIDREYIEALPEEMREEVVMAQFAEQRSQQAQSGGDPSEINREFLEALPRDIQQELLRSEQAERRRRERDEARRRDREQGAQAQPEEMNNADFMAMLDPALRQAVLLDADDTVLAALPDDLQAEARALFGDRRMPRPDRLPRSLEAARASILNGQAVPREGEDEREPSRQRRPVAQLLNKSGVATLLRLMFVSLNHKSKSNLHSILSDVCKNTTNRAEVISILLSILQDGTADVNAVERSFAQLSLRAKQPVEDKKPLSTPLKRTNTGQPAVIAPSTDLSPMNIVQQCLGTLNALATDNERVKSFFLNEHETSSTQKIKAARKGKARESKAARYPVNALLALLDRKLITENISVMETLASLLVQVTKPLQLLVKRAKEARDEAKRHSTNNTDGADGAERPETSTSDVPMQEAPTVFGETSAAATQPAIATANDTDAVVDTQAKRKKTPLPPDVPEENIRLVVNILAARECPSKTFSDTLDIIKNLSAIPGAKEVFGKELIRQASELSQDLLPDLEDLAKQISSAQTGTDLQGMALASFSSAGSKQRKLLRVLVALDHLFDPKRTPTVQTQTSSGPEIDQKLKDDILATLYESGTFDKLWQNLSICLAAIRERGNMVNVATILLPLIESLMVVCRNSALKEAPQVVASPAETAISTPPPEARMEILFFNFTEEHRKILNELIRNNPKLMNGNLSVLAKNSKVLEFDNKRNYFSRKLHDRRAEARVSHPSLQLSIRRDQVFLDSFKSLYYKSGNEIKYGKLNIRFHGEEGIDAGGVSREWFAAMARQMFNPDYALFNPVASDRTTFHPNNLSEVNPEHLMFFKFIGRIIGKALYENRVLDCHFSRAVYRKILGKNVSLKDMETLDLDYYKSLVWILENDITDITFETFSTDVDKFGVTETIDLVPNGRDISVTEENKHEYVRLVVEHRLVKSVQQQIDHFLEGFHEIIPAELISIFNEQELELLISGLPDIDVDDWKNNTDYTNYQPTSPQIQWFWRAVRSFDKEEKAKLLQFVTGTSKVPLNGFKELEGMNGFARFNIHRDYSSKDKLPSSHTCFNQLDLPEYESYEHLRQQMYTAITAGSEYFGFA